MTKITLAAAAAGFIVLTMPMLATSATAQGQGPAVQVTPGVQVGPGGVTVGQKPKCRTVTTTVETPDGRKTTKKERRCEGE